MGHVSTNDARNPIGRKLPLQQKMENTMRFGAANFLLLLSLFLYVCPINLGFDTQPFALMLSTLIVTFTILKTKKISMNSNVFVLFLMFFVACFFFAINANKAAGLRSLAGYASLFMVTLASYRTSRYIKTTWFNFAVYLYLSVGIIQLTVDKKFGAFLLPRMSTSVERGITSLAVEPSAYAVVCIFMLMINDFLLATGKQNKRKYFIITLLLIAQILVTLSGIGLLFLTVYLTSKVISILLKDGIAKHKGKLIIFALIIGSVFASFRNIDSLQRSRGGLVLNAAISNPKLLLIEDGSIADRLTHAILPIYSLSYSHGVGLGMGTWAKYAINLRSYAGGFIEIMGQHATLTVDRIMSGWGTALYELGSLGFVYMFVFINIIVAGAKTKDKKLAMVYISSGITIWLLMFMSIPLAFPLFSFMMGMFMYETGKRAIENNPNKI
ncbi:hypothetical protein [Paenibacillus apii]|uniref:hypothetical protein n=1 Tax=Paenibacillus apii TaxID=1850370 RepID=UPI00143AABF2|nr:hypothetical protein [Paenibacillus apii]NJJ38539.1 hypothetical protein [Paenibacillus apii]